MLLMRAIDQGSNSAGASSNSVRDVAFKALKPNRQRQSNQCFPKRDRNN